MAAGPNKHRVSPSGRTAGRRYTVSVTIPTLASTSTTEVTCTLTGASTSDVVDVNPATALTSGLGIVGKRISSAGVLSVLVANVTSTSVTGGAAQSLRVCLQRFTN